MDTVTKPTIVVDYGLYMRKGSEDLQWHIEDRADDAHLVAVVTDAKLDPYADPDGPAWDMVIKNSSNLDPEEFNAKAARVLSGTALTPGVVFTYDEFLPDWYVVGGAALVVTNVQNF